MPPVTTRASPPASSTSRAPGSQSHGSTCGCIQPSRRPAATQASSSEPGPAWRTRPLAEAHVATSLRQDRLVLPGVRAAAHRLLDRTGLIRHAGPGSLELAWVAAGRLDAWVQPAVDPWDWLPGALLVTQAGGEARVMDIHGTRWHLAGAAALLDEIELALG